VNEGAIGGGMVGLVDDGKRLEDDDDWKCEATELLREPTICIRLQMRELNVLALEKGAHHRLL
jgi:hypothetical protein